MKFVLSNESVNSYGFIVLTDGIDLTRFEQNPVMLSDHKNSNQNVLGRWKDWSKDNSELSAEPEFDVDDADAAKVKGKVDRGFIKGASVGINILSVEVLEGYTAPVVTKSELMEASIIPVPSNSTALKLYYKGEPLNDAGVTALLTALDKNPLPNQNPMQLTDEEKKTRLDLGLPETATAKEVADKIAEMKATSLAAKTAKVKALIATAKAENKITDEQAPTFELAANADFDAVEAQLKAMPVLKTTPKRELITDRLQHGNNRSGNPGGDDVPEERKSWTFLEWQKNDQRGLNAMKADNPELYEKLQADYKQSVRNKYPGSFN